jgi:hypothetical protein
MLQVQQNRIHQRNKRLSNFKKDRNKKEVSNDVLRCYKCNKTGYIKVNYPLLKKKKKESSSQRSNKSHMEL